MSRRFNWPEDFGPVPLPAWIQRDERWKEQLDLAYEIVHRFDTDDVVFLQAPTGTGKTLIAELSRRLMSAKAVYACSTKALQDQFAHDFPYAKVVKGRANYLTMSGALNMMGLPAEPGAESDVTCADCNWSIETAQCQWCDSRSLCPYVLARSKAENAPLAVLNTSYLLTDANKGKGRFVGRDLTVLDEADVDETELLNHVEVSLTQRRMARLNLDPPKRKTVERSWVDWVNKVAEPGIRAYHVDLPNPYRSGASPQDIREYQRSERLLASIELLAKELPEGGWIYDGYNDGNVIFRPVRVNKYGGNLLWRHGKKFLCMSATILSADLMADELGVCYDKERAYSIIDVPSNFPVENRPIYVVPVADMSYKNKLTAWPSMLSGVRGVLRRHSDERILVHCVSYELARFLVNGLKDEGRPIVTYYGSAHKAKALRDYTRYPNAVLVAASMDRGIDLPDDLCRVQIVAKIPWPNVSDKRISQRMHSRGGRDWYMMQAVRSLIQMTGRGVRSRTDHAKTYILDGQFGSNLWASGQYLFPRWWKEALDWRTVNKRQLLKEL